MTSHARACSSAVGRRTRPSARCSAAQQPCASARLRIRRTACTIAATSASRSPASTITPSRPSGDDFLRGAARGNARRRCAHRLEVDEAESLVRAGHDEKRRVAIERREAAPRPPVQGRLWNRWRLSPRSRECVVAIARDDQARVRGWHASRAATLRSARRAPCSVHVRSCGRR